MAAPDGSAHRRAGSGAPPAGEPIFLDAGLTRGIRTLTGDFANFVLTLAFYPLCWFLGGAAFLVDNMFRTAFFDRFIVFVEYIDNGGK